MRELKTKSVTRRIEAGQPFRWRAGVSGRRTTLLVVDLAAVMAGVLVAVSLSSGRTEEFTQGSAWLRLAALALVWLMLAAAFDVYAVSALSSRVAGARATLFAGTVTVLVAVEAVALVPGLERSAETLAVTEAVVIVCLLAGRAAYTVVGRALLAGRRVLVVGGGPAAVAVAEAIDREAGPLFSVAGWVMDGQGVETSLDGSGRDWTGVMEAIAPIVGDWRTLPALAAEHDVTMLVLAGEDSPTDEFLQALISCAEAGVHVTPMPAFYERLTGRVPVEYLAFQGSEGTALDRATRGLGRRALKRVTDVILASAGLTLLGIALPFIAAAIRLDSPGPIFYTQERVGKGGRRFRVYKFRSMVIDAERDGVQWARKDDHRVTRVGKLLRATHVDEFPQFLNILKGEMSAVGPRPERPEFVEHLAAEIPLYRLRHLVRPGMAGWGLVKQGYGASKEDALVKLEYDLYYIKHQSLWLDVIILLKTILDTITFGGR